MLDRYGGPPPRTRTIVGGARAVYACCRCHHIISSPVARCRVCGWSHSLGEATAIR